MPQFLGIPDVIWSGVIASSITLVGVWLSNRGNSERLRAQLDNDAKEKVKQRKSDLRRLVYLEFVEEMVKANVALSALPNLDMTAANPAEGLIGFNSAAAKLQLISEIETAEAVGDVQVKFAELSIRAMVKAQKIANVKTNIDIQNNLYESADREIQRILAAMTAFNEAARKDQEVFDALSRSFEFHRDLAAQYSERRSNLWKERNALHVEFTKFLAAAAIEMRDETAKAQILIRSELELEESRAEIEERVRVRAIENQKAIQEALGEALSSIEGSTQPS
ncbi:hypothetical protein [Ralstonia sp.]|uniref:hypothetical protein n=1 Tax=Ralstonia sp. TaxID=54061 RepID=UPI0031D4FD24